MKNQQIFLASQSPRRRTLLEQLGITFETVNVAVDESHREGESAEDYVSRVALEKARAGWQQVAAFSIPVIGADTCIVLDETIIGKPADRDHGIALLKRFSGNTHRVLTAVALVGHGEKGERGETRQAVRVNTSSVTFRLLSLTECEQYWDTGEPIDKAGGYAIQGKGAAFIKNIEGSYSGIMGLPLCELTDLMTEFGIHWLEK